MTTSTEAPRAPVDVKAMTLQELATLYHAVAQEIRDRAADKETNK